MINTVELTEWIDANNMKDLTIKYFWEYVSMYMDDIDDEYSNTLKRMYLGLISLELYKVSYSKIYEIEQDIIEVQLDINYFEDTIGLFKVIYSPEAEYLDEKLDLNDIHYIIRLTDVYEKMATIIINALKEEIGVNIIAKITNLNEEQIKLLIHGYED